LLSRFPTKIDFIIIFLYMCTMYFDHIPLQCPLLFPFSPPAGPLPVPK
jgi:hypothetical protein